MRSTKPTKITLDPVATRAAILDSATALFAESGFAATSLNAIAQAADVPKSLILYHFETKENLWQAVFREKGRMIFEAAQAIIDGEPGVTLEHVAIAKFRTLQQNPELVRLMAWMSLESREPNPQIAAQAKKVRETIRSNPERFPVPHGLQPEDYFVVLMSAIDGFFRFRGVYSRMLDHPMNSPSYESDFLENLLTLVRSQKPENSHGL
ncbi:MAG: TetR/AcrR family transcriptional regulator [Fimbriimonadaceae bacterium]